MNLLRSLAAAKALFQQRTLVTMLTSNPVDHTDLIIATRAQRLHNRSASAEKYVAVHGVLKKGMGK